jgi:lipoic acid synthetase
VSGSAGEAAGAGPRKPAWLRVGIPSGAGARDVSGLLSRHGLATVCDSARCPNKAECWGARTATFMVLGSVCTRFCRFCAVEHRREGEPLRPDEPRELALAVAELGLAYAVVTSVDRDDLPDRGAAHFAACARELKALGTAAGVASGAAAGRAPRVELLIPDYREGEIELVLDSGCDVLAHNVETVERLQGLRDKRASYAASLHTLALAADHARGRGGKPLVKSSLMLGLGEEREEALRAMDDLRAAGCSILVMGQYLRPTKSQVPVARYVEPEEFDSLAEEARARGFASVVSAPLARTSYHARGAFEKTE